MSIRTEEHDYSPVPPWFKVKSYSGLSELDETEWYLQFVCRRMLNELAEIEAGEERRALGRDDFAYKLFEQLSFRPIAKLDDIATLDFPLGFLNLTVYAEALWPTNSRLLGVRPTTVSELFEQQALLEPDFRKRALQYFSELELHTTAKEHTIDMLVERRRRHFLNGRLPEACLEMDGEHSSSQLGHEPRFDEPTFASQTIVPPAFVFTVNPLLPDELLVAQFRTALAQSREFFAETGYTFQDRDERFEKQKERWTNYLVLPFLDLKKGFEITGHPVKNEEVWRVLSSAYESEGIGVDLGKDDSTLRKTNQVSAMEMMTPFSRRFSILEARVASLQSERPGSTVPGQNQNLSFEDHHFRQYRKK